MLKALLRRVGLTVTGLVVTGAALAQAPAPPLKQYHQPSDKLDGTWNFDGMIEDAQLDFMAGWIIAQGDTMPSWKPGDEFEAARKRALAAVGGN